MKCRQMLSVLASMYVATIACAKEPQAPEVRVTNVRRVFHNGEHNAFTHMIRFRDRFYLAFRSCPDGHMIYPTSSNIILESEDGQTWKKVHHFRVPKRDLRDPHFLVLHELLHTFFHIIWEH